MKKLSVLALSFIISSILAGGILFHPSSIYSKNINKEDTKEAVNQKNSHEVEAQTTQTIPQSGPDEGDNRHPSGKDRSVENGHSGTQGKSPSDPDKMANAFGGNTGKDKVGYDGGLDKNDQDGNNGCGNDDDFEDDNNGNCGGKQKQIKKTTRTITPQPVIHENKEKNPNNCDANGSNGDRNGKPCNPGKNNASLNGCTHGEPDCVTRVYVAYNKQKLPLSPSPTPSEIKHVNGTATLNAAFAPTGSFLGDLGRFLQLTGLTLALGGILLARKFKNS